MKSLLRVVACLFVLLSFNTKALDVNGCTIKPFTFCVGADLSDADVHYANLTGANLSGADLSGANLTIAFMSYTNLSSANLSGANLSGSDLSYANLISADLSNTDLSGVYLYGVSGLLANASGITLPSGYIIANNYIVGAGVNLTGADLTGADLSGADLTRATLTGVSGQLADATGIILTSGYILEGLIIKPDSDNDGYSDELELAISGDTTSADSATFTAMLTNLRTDADNDGVPDEYETAAGGDTTSSTFESVLAMLTTAKNVPAMGSIGLLALGLSMLGLGAVRLKK